MLPKNRRKSLFLMTFLPLLVALLFAHVLLPMPALAAKRHALVIGIDRYPALPATRQLQKAANDARAMSIALEELGFSVTRLENSTKLQMSRALGALEQSIEPGDTVFVFFAGHGIDIAGTNYLLPSDIPSPVDKAGRRLPTRAMRDSSFNAAELLSSLQERGASPIIAVFDACREPFDDEGKRSLNLRGGGLARMQAHAGMFIMYSAGAKQLALDRLTPTDENPNSVFTRTLVPLLHERGLSLVTLAKRLQPKVSALAGTVGHVQTPAYYDQIIGDFYLLPPLKVSTPPSVAAPPPPCAGAETHWRIAESIGNEAAFEDHIKRFPNCGFAGLAHAKLLAFRENSSSANEPTSSPCDDAESHWKSTELIGTKSALEDHINRFGDCVYAGLAKAKLAALRSASLPPAPEPERELERAGPSERPGSYWDYSGSTIHLEAQPTSSSRKFSYFKPSGTAANSGARSGKVLFSGRRRGSQYVGTAYVYAGRCGAFTFSVDGSVRDDDRTVVLLGRRPRIDPSSCKIRGYERARIELTYRYRVN